MSITTHSETPHAAMAYGRGVKLFFTTAIIVLIAESIGNFTIPITASTKIVLFPLLWALMLAATLGVVSKRVPPSIAISRDVQDLAAAVLQPAMLIFIAKLALLVGGNLPKIISSGWGLVFQEFGHFFGTMMIGLPIALMLGIKREAVGATFSVGREPSLAIIGERFGMNSPEGHGALAEYLTGTVFGAIFIALLASVLTSTGIFNPLALAMGAGVGSGTMMTAAAGAIAAQQTPEVAKHVAAFAAASNLITTTIGTYFTLFISLPFTLWAYKTLEPVLGRMSKRSPASTGVAVESAAHESHKPLSFGAHVFIWVFVALVALIGNWVNFKQPPDLATLAGAGIMAGVVFIGYLLYRVTFRKLPALIWVTVIGMAASYPTFPFAAEIAVLTGKINFMAITTPILAIAGLSIAKDIPAFRRLGWRIVVVSFAASAGSFIGAAVIAQFFMHAI